MCTTNSHIESECENCHRHDEQNHGKKLRAYILPAFSFVLLAVCLTMEHTGAKIFDYEWCKILWYLAAFLPVGIPVALEAIGEIAKKDVFNEFTLMTIAAVCAFCIGEYAEAVGVMLFYTIGENLQHAAVDRATRNISDLLDVRPEKATVLRNGTLTETSPKDVAVGEVIEIKPGERVPLDGKLIAAEAVFDTSALTGESKPKTLSEGDEVLAGMISSDRTVRLEVIRPFEKSELSRILELVENATERKAPSELFIRKFSRIYTPVVIALAILIVAVPAIVAAVHPSFAYNFQGWLYRGLVFLVISCPCALVISIPLGYFGGIGAASKAGILFKGSNYIDAITKVDTIAFDKTGTLTKGRFEVTEVLPRDIPEKELLSCVLTAEAKSNHPIAKAIVEYCRNSGAMEETAERMQESGGHGVVATIAGKQVAVGNRRLMKERGIEVPETVEDGIRTVVHCSIDRKYSGAFFLSDSPKEDAAQAVAELRKAGISDIRLLSGDSQDIAEAIAKEVGISTACGGLLPEDKAAIIEQARAKGRTVAFVGDGMNDAPVLALSDVGIAMGGLGSDAAIESADVVIQDDKPSKVAKAVRIAKATRAIVQQNIVGSVGIKVAIMVAGALGYASLWMAVFADVGVALLAVLNSLRVLGKR